MTIVSLDSYREKSKKYKREKVTGNNSDNVNIKDVVFISKC